MNTFFILTYLLLSVTLADSQNATNCTEETEYDPEAEICVAVSCEAEDACQVNETCIPEEQECDRAPCPQFRCESGGNQSEACPTDTLPCEDGTTRSRSPDHNCTFHPPCPDCADDVQDCANGLVFMRDPTFGCDFRPCPVPETCSDDQPPMTCPNDTCMRLECHGNASANAVCYTDGCGKCEARWVDEYGREVDCRDRDVAIMFTLRFAGKDAHWFMNLTEEERSELRDEIANAAGIDLSRVKQEGEPQLEEDEDGATYVLVNITFVPPSDHNNTNDDTSAEDAFHQLLEEYEDSDSELRSGDISQRLDFSYTLNMTSVELTECSPGEWEEECESSSAIALSASPFLLLLLITSRLL